ncbi:hypothetical protein ABZZ79_03265 [Streptomyces sp. NPDC006458]|uniref:hypothetical protein n=1 Tax=Streptomyces sp. NPDC006458 TaxID=3154302 RepID=UPI00339E13B4
MPRIQILELPTIYRENGDDETPFALVIDQASEETIKDLTLWHGESDQPAPHRSLAEQLGARAVLCFEDTVDIPANEWRTPAPAEQVLNVHVDGDAEQIRRQVEESAARAVRANAEARPA